MELKSYQKEVLQDLSSFLDIIHEGEPLNKAFASYWLDRGVDVYSLEGNHFLHSYDNSVKGVPNITVKVPTAGGKTFIACNALKPLFKYYPTGKPKVVAWFVPSDTILKQTLKNLRNPEHPYRQRLDSIFGGKVCVVDKEDALMGHGISPVSVMEQVTIFVLSVQSFATNNKDGRRSYRENENLAEYSRYYDSLTSKIEGADETSLIQVLSYLNPVVVVDESHNFEANLRVEVLRAINPQCILNLTATPRQSSNIISFVDAIKLKRANMVKLPVVVYNHKTTNDVLVSAVQLQRSLEARAIAEEQRTGKYIRPIVLCQAQPRIGDENVTYDKVKRDLIEIGIPEDQIKIKTGEKDEIKNMNLLSRDCPVRYIITVDALKEGWDCPFAYVLASLANRTSRVSVEQILGRILRLPYTTKHTDDLLNLSYVFTSSADFSDTLNRIISSLNNAGFSRKDYRVNEKEEWGMSPSATVNGFVHTTLFDNQDNVLRDSPLENSECNSEYDIDVEKVKEGLNSEKAEDFAAKLEDFAQKESESYNKQIEASEDDVFSSKGLPSEMQDMVKRNVIKDIFIQDALSISLPRFKRKINVSSLFEGEGSLVPLDKKMLLERIDLSKQDHTVDFVPTEADAIKLDLEKVGNDDYEVQKSKISAKQLTYIQEQFQSLPDESKRNSIALNIARLIRLDEIPEHHIVEYVKKAIEGLDNEKVSDMFLNEPVYAKIFRNKLNDILTTYQKKMFCDWLDTDQIVCEADYRFPETMPVSSKILGVKKGLYLDEGDMNGFEERVINEIANLENVEYWHRNAERGLGFGINGFINHYPDFIVKLKSGKILLIETKGDDRDNSDSKNKIELGQMWAKAAGGLYRYYMVFDTKQVDGALTLAQLIERVSQL